MIEKVAPGKKCWWRKVRRTKRSGFRWVIGEPTLNRSWYSLLGRRAGNKTASRVHTETWEKTFGKLPLLCICFLGERLQSINQYRMSTNNKEVDKLDYKLLNSLLRGLVWDRQCYFELLRSWSQHKLAMSDVLTRSQLCPRPSVKLN